MVEIKDLMPVGNELVEEFLLNRLEALWTEGGD